MGYLLLVVAGALLCNAIPHLTAGLRGEAFPTPFSRQPGVAPSPPLINVLWGSANLLPGLYIAEHRLPVVQHGLLALVVGFVALGLGLALHFGKVRRGR